jgi:hypothetical protein
VGGVSFTADKVPPTKHLDIDADRSTTSPEGVTNAGTMKLHATITFSKVS